MEIKNLLIENCKSSPKLAELYNTLNEIKVIFPAKDFNVWYSTKYNKDIRPLDGEMVLYSVWYDGPNYGIGMYDKDTDELILHDNRLLEDCTRLTFDDFDVWMMFHEPNFSSSM